MHEPAFPGRRISTTPYTVSLGYPLFVNELVGRSPPSKTLVPCLNPLRNESSPPSCLRRPNPRSNLQLLAPSEVHELTAILFKDFFSLAISCGRIESFRRWQLEKNWRRVQERWSVVGSACSTSTNWIPSSFRLSREGPVSVCSPSCNGARYRASRNKQRVEQRRSSKVVNIRVLMISQI